MVLNLIDLLVSHEHGNTALSIVKLPKLKPGSILLECVFVIECSAPQNLQIHRHLPPAIIRVDEISTLENQKNNLNNCMKKAYARLDSSRLIVAG